MRAKPAIVVLGLCLALLARPGWAAEQATSANAFLLLEMDLDSVVRESLEGTVSAVRRSLRRERIPYTGLVGDLPSGGGVTFRLIDSAQIERLRNLLQSLDTNLTSRVTSDGTFRLELDEGALLELRDSTVVQSIQIIRHRLDEVRARAPVIQRLGENWIIIELELDETYEQKLALLSQIDTLPAPLTLIEERTTGPLDRTVGRDSGGILMEVRTTGAADLKQLRARLAALNLGEISLQHLGSPTDFLIRLQRQEGGRSAAMKAISAMRSALRHDAVEFPRTAFVGPNVMASYSPILRRPVEGSETAVTLEFGDENEKGAVHLGVDFAAEESAGATAIYPIARGKIVCRGWNGGVGVGCNNSPPDKNRLPDIGLGWFIIIEHGSTSLPSSMPCQRLFSLYGHLANEPRLQNGQDVGRTDVIGIMGDTGGATGRHLHLEVQDGCTWDTHTLIDPETWIREAWSYAPSRTEFLDDPWYCRFFDPIELIKNANLKARSNCSIVRETSELLENKVLKSTFQ